MASSLKIESVNGNPQDRSMVTSRKVSDSAGSVELFDKHAVFTCPGVQQVFTDARTAMAILDSSVEKAGHSQASEGAIENISRGNSTIKDITVVVDSPVMAQACPMVKQRADQLAKK